MLEVQQPQQGRHRDQGAAQPRVEVRPPGDDDEGLVVQVGVDAGELIGEAGGLVG